MENRMDREGQAFGDERSPSMEGERSSSPALPPAPLGTSRKKRGTVLANGMMALFIGLPFLLVIGVIIGVASRNQTIPSLTEQWSFQAGDQLTSSPIVVNGIVYIGSSDDKVYALDAASGTLKWSFQAGGFPTVVNGVVYVSTHYDGKVYALDAASGTLKWSFQVGGQLTSSPIVVNGLVYVGSDNLYALDAASGTLKWSFWARGSTVLPPDVIVVNGLVYISSSDDNLYALDAASGTLKWSFQAGGSTLFSPIVVNGIVYISTYGGQVYAIQAP